MSSFLLFPFVWVFPELMFRPTPHVVSSHDPLLSRPSVGEGDLRRPFPFLCFL